MKTFTRLSLLGLTALMMFGCGNESTKLVPKAIIPKEDFSEKPSDFTVFNPKVDILFVIDDSGSMADAQNNLSRNAYQFADAMGQSSILDFHIGVVSTDMDNKFSRSGRLIGTPAFVSKTTPDMVNNLARRMIVGTSGSATEIMFEPVFAGLSLPLTNTYNKDFYRQDAYLAVIFLTDADDQGSYDPKTFMQFLTNLKGDATKVLGYGVIRTMATKDSCDGMEDVTGKLENFLSLVGNADKMQKNILSLCEPDYGVKLAEFAKDIVKRSAGAVKLSRVPVVNSIRVTYGVQVIPNSLKDGWVYEPSTNSILLSEGIQWDYKQGTNVGLKIDFEVIDVKD